MIPGSRLTGHTQQRVMTGGGSSFLLDGGLGSQNAYKGEEDLIMTKLLIIVYTKKFCFGKQFYTAYNWIYTDYIGML